MDPSIGAMVPGRSPCSRSEVIDEDGQKVGEIRPSTRHALWGLSPPPDEFEVFDQFDRQVADIRPDTRSDVLGNRRGRFEVFDNDGNKLGETQLAQRAGIFDNRAGSSAPISGKANGGGGGGGGGGSDHWSDDPVLLWLAMIGSLIFAAVFYSLRGLWILASKKWRGTLAAITATGLAIWLFPDPVDQLRAPSSSAFLLRPLQTWQSTRVNRNGCWAVLQSS